MEFFGNISHKYQYQPLTRETKFGTLDNPMALTVYYEGQEKINTTLIWSSENNLQSDGCFYIEIHWSGFSYFRTRTF
jgi:hypothetical protein